MASVSKSWFQYKLENHTGQEWEKSIEVQAYGDAGGLMQKLFQEGTNCPNLTHLKIRFSSVLMCSEVGDENALPLTVLFPAIPYLWEELQSLTVIFSFQDEMILLEEFYFLTIEPFASNYLGFQAPESDKMDLFRILPRQLVCGSELWRRCQKLQRFVLGPISFNPQVVDMIADFLQSEGGSGFLMRRHFQRRPICSAADARDRMSNVSTLAVELTGYGDFPQMLEHCAGSFCANNACAQNCREVWEKRADEEVRKCAQDAAARPDNHIQALGPGWGHNYEGRGWESRGWPTAEMVPADAYPVLTCEKAHFKWACTDITPDADDRAQCSVEVPMTFRKLKICLQGIKTLKPRV
jgi:hypothetical protein